MYVSCLHNFRRHWCIDHSGPSQINNFHFIFSAHKWTKLVLLIARLGHQYFCICIMCNSLCFLVSNIYHWHILVLTSSSVAAHSSDRSNCKILRAEACTNCEDYPAKWDRRSLSHLSICGVSILFNNCSNYLNYHSVP